MQEKSLCGWLCSCFCGCNCCCLYDHLCGCLCSRYCWCHYCHHHLLHIPNNNVFDQKSAFITFCFVCFVHPLLHQNKERISLSSNFMNTVFNHKSPFYTSKKSTTKKSCCLCGCFLCCCCCHHHNLPITRNVFFEQKNEEQKINRCTQTWIK